MDFPREPAGYEKGILSDLQGAWSALREAIAESRGFDGADRALFHIDQAMSWEVVRRLEQMSPLLLLVRNICLQGKASNEIMGIVEDLSDIMDEVQAKIRTGKVL